jgi:hypothetical protein
VADAPKPGTLRVAPDLYAALTKAAAGAGCSATKLADDLLRVGLGLVEPTAKVTRKQLAEQKARPVGACTHPISRRIGSGCARCGDTKAHGR